MNIDKTRPIDQLFAKEDLDSFLASILSKASSGTTPPGFEQIAKISKRARTSFADIIAMILQGEVTEFYLSPSHRGIMSLMVRKDDIQRVTTARRTWVNLKAGAKAIKIRENALTALVRNGIIPSEGISPVMLKPEDLTAFKDTYVSGRDLSRRYRSLRDRTNRFSMVKAIALAGLEPAFDQAKTVTKFYRRDAVLAAFGPPPD